MKNNNNEEIKYTYFEFPKESNRKSEKTIDLITKTLVKFEKFLNFVDFKFFNKDFAIEFKKKLLKSKNKKNEPLSKSTIYHELTHLKDFFK